MIQILYQNIFIFSLPPIHLSLFPIHISLSQYISISTLEGYFGLLLSKLVSLRKSKMLSNIEQRKYIYCSVSVRDFFIGWLWEERLRDNSTITVLTEVEYYAYIYTKFKHQEYYSLHSNHTFCLF